ncbi:MAG: molybdopterin-dependent oxidoreductase [Cyclobacteriaceae bacterium]|nr:molybdopterin-dependent oxidoreductase [Cyclobacteriaceae bacterium]
MKNNTIDTTGLLERSVPRGMGRRSFLKRFSGGVVIAVSLLDFEALEAAVLQDYPADLNAYLSIGKDGRVACYTGKIEMGQGVITSLAQMIAEELDVSLHVVDMVMGDTDLCPYDRGTWGSQTTRIFGPALRAAAAEARAILLQLAAAQLKVPLENLVVTDGTVFHRSGRQQSITYGQLTEGNKIVKTLSEKPKLKSPSEFKIIGKPVLHMDAMAKVTGAALYAGDVRLPGMRYAKILRPPSHDARMVKLDVSAVENEKDIMLIQDNGLVAVLHEDYEMAEKYLDKIKVEYDIPETGLNENTIFDHLINVAPQATMLGESGSVQFDENKGEEIIESTFLDGYVAHAPMEPHTALAVMENGRMKIWASTQNPFGLRGIIATELNMKEEQVQIMQIFLGGGFGGKSSNGQAVEAARLAKASAMPVMVAWTRREEFFTIPSDLPPW